MSKTRIKIVPPEPIASRVEMETVVGEIAKHKAKEQELTASMNQEIERVRRTYTQDLADLAEKIDAKSARVMAWTVANPELFASARSIATMHGTVGYRLGNWTVEKQKGWTWDRVIEKIRDFVILSKKNKEEKIPVDPASFEERITAYLRAKLEVNKEGLIADRASFKDEELLRIGVQVVQEESFFILPKIETVETRITEVA